MDDNTPTPEHNPDELRRKAEQQVRHRGTEPQNLPDSFNWQRLAHELQVHQVELEMQNEELVRSRAEVERSRNEYAQLYDYAPVSYCTLDKNGIILKTNLMACQLLGYEKRSRLVGQRFNSFIPAEQTRTFYDFFHQVFRTHYKQTCELSLRDKAGKPLYVRLEGLAGTDEAGNPQCFTAIIDLTERQIAEEKLRNREIHLRESQEIAHIGSWEWDVPNNQITWSDELYRLVGAEPGRLDIRAENYRNFIHPDDYPRVMAGIQRMLDEQIPLESQHRIIRRDGQVRHVHAYSRILRNARGETAHIRGVVQDITERVTVQQEAQSKTEIINGILENLPVILWRINKSGIIQEIYGSGLRTLGLANDELCGKNYFELFPQAAQPMRQVLRGHHGQFLVRINQPEKTIYKHNFFFYDPAAGEAFGFCLDVTEQRAAEIELQKTRQELAQETIERRQQEQLAAILIDYSEAGVFSFYQSLQITSWNTSMEKVMNILRKQAIGRQVSDIFSPEQYPAETEAIQRTLSGERTSLYNRSYPIRSGYFEVNLVPLLDKSKASTGGLCVVRDVSERRKLEEDQTDRKLAQQKEFLNAILDAQESERRRIAEALHNGLGQLLYATKLNAEKLPAMAENSVKERVNNLLDEAIRETRSISHDLIPTLLEDFGLEAAIEDFCSKFRQSTFQISCDVIGFGKRPDRYLEIAIYRITQELLNNVVKHAAATRTDIQVLRRKHEILIQVEDNGKGFDVETALNNTRTSLGLKSIRDRVKLLNGTLTIESAPGRGSTITIKLPTG
jgi:PAS domain S-box-containing protein